MYTDSRESREAFAGGNREASRPAKGWFMPFRRRSGGPAGPPRGRRRRIRSSLQMFAAVSLIACSLILHGCGGGGRAPVAAPEGGGPAPTLPPATTPTPEPTPPPEPAPEPTPPPDPTPPTTQPPPLTSTPAPEPTPPSPPAPTPPDAARFSIKSHHNSIPAVEDDEDTPDVDEATPALEGIDAVAQILESIDADADLKPYLGGHVLSYVRFPGTQMKWPPIRESLGLPATGTDFLDASGLAAVLAKGVSNRFDRSSGRGSGSGWEFDGSLGIYLNWVDGVFFGTAISTHTYTVAPFVLGVPSGVNPAGTEGTAVWTGSVAGRESGPYISIVDGRATLTYDFEAANLDVTFDRLRNFIAGLNPQDVSDITWEDLSVSSGSFGDCSGTGDCIRGRFFDDNEGNAAESIGGVFRRGDLYGAFGADR